MEQCAKCTRTCSTLSNSTVICYGSDDASGSYCQAVGGGFYSLIGVAFLIPILLVCVGCCVGSLIRQRKQLFQQQQNTMLEMSLRLSTITSARYDLETSSIHGEYKEMKSDDDESHASSRLLVVQASDDPSHDFSSSASTSSVSSIISPPQQPNDPKTQKKISELKSKYNYKPPSPTPAQTNNSSLSSSLSFTSSSVSSVSSGTSNGSSVRNFDEVDIGSSYQPPRASNLSVQN